MYKCEIRDDFEIEWLENIKEVIEFHGSYVSGDMISLTLSDLRHLAEGKFLVWNVEICIHKYCILMKMLRKH